MIQGGNGTREQWGSKLGFILAAAGGAIGLGNIWRFPYVLGNNGGFAFLLVYVICVILIGLPIMGAELAIGRGSGRNPVGAFKALAPKSAWWLVGLMGLITGVIIMSYYSVVAGWTLAYFFKSLTGFTSQFADASEASTAFGNFVSSSGQVVLYHFAFTFLCIIVVFQGVKGGIERWSKILMPTLFFLLIMMIVRSLTLPGSENGLKFLFNPDFSKLNSQVILTAMGQAFYSLSLGMGAMITYGSYLNKKTNLFSSATTIAGLDMGIAIFAGIAIFPALFAVLFAESVAPGSGTGLTLADAQGPGLTFIVLPMVFTHMPFGHVLGTLFFLLLSIAALTSAISLLEVMVSFATDELKWTRSRATVIMAAFAFVLGVPSALSFGMWEDIKIFGMGFFDLADYLTANILLPGGGIFIALFIGWGWKYEKVVEEIKMGHPSLKWFKTWIWSLRILAPLAMTVILITNVLPEGGQSEMGSDQEETQHIEETTPATDENDDDTEIKK